MKSKVLLFVLVCITQMSLIAHHEHSCPLPTPNPMEGQIIDLTEHCSELHCIKVVFPTIEHRDTFWSFLQIPDNNVWKYGIEPVLLTFQISEQDPTIIFKTCQDITCYVRAALAQDATCINIVFANIACRDAFKSFVVQQGCYSIIGCPINTCCNNLVCCWSYKASVTNVRVTFTQWINVFTARYPIYAGKLRISGTTTCTSCRTGTKQICTASCSTGCYF